MVKQHHQRIRRSPDWYHATPASPIQKSNKSKKSEKNLHSTWNSILPHLSYNQKYLEIWEVQTTLSDKDVIRSCIVTKKHAIFPTIRIGNRGDGIDFMAFKSLKTNIKKKDILRKESIVYSKCSSFDPINQWNQKLQAIIYNGKEIQYNPDKQQPPLFKKEKEDNELVRNASNNEWYDKYHYHPDDTEEGSIDCGEDEPESPADLFFINNNNEEEDYTNNDHHNSESEEEDDLNDSDEDDVDSDTFNDEEEEEDYTTLSDTNENEKYF